MARLSRFADLPGFAGLPRRCVPATAPLAGSRDGRYGVLKNQLLLVIGFEDDRILVKSAEPTHELDSAHEENRYGQLFPAEQSWRPGL